MTNEERDLITRFIERVAGRPPVAQLHHRRRRTQALAAAGRSARPTR